MEYKAKKCPICGSFDIVEISNESIHDNVFYKYGCNACLEVFSTKNDFLEKERNSKINNKSNILSPNEIFKRNINNIISIRCNHNDSIKCGTGILIGNGYVLTNKHVVLDSNDNDDIIDLCDTFIGMGEFISSCELEFVYADKDNDIALLHSDKLEGKISFSNDSIETGDVIYAIGNSKGYGLCIVNGLVSDNARIINKKEYIMVSAPTTKGNSGGPLLNSYGDLVGMITMGDSVIQTMNYAIPVSILVNFIKKASLTEELNINI